MSEKPPIDPKLLSRARAMRREDSIAEAKLWRRLRAGRLNETKWRREVVVAGYILDFYCHEARLAVEIDGESHDDAAVYDGGRTAALAKVEVHVVRFTNEDALFRFDGLVKAIWSEYRSAIERLGLGTRPLP